MTTHRYFCTRCRKTTTFKLKSIPYGRWSLTCRKCGRYSLHLLILEEPYPPLIAGRLP